MLNHTERIGLIFLAGSLLAGEMITAIRQKGQTNYAFQRFDWKVMQQDAQNQQEKQRQEMTGEELPARINLNTASVAELQSLPGIGPKIAAAIITERQKAPFRQIEDLLRVKGIGPKSLAALRRYITVK